MKRIEIGFLDGRLVGDIDSRIEKQCKNDDSIIEQLEIGIWLPLAQINDVIFEGEK